jgi:glycosyltransferase involved in cell wall biosynthesis
MPHFSIITINFNNREGLHKTMQSVFEQSFRDFEYIVIDGGSTDGSAELVKENASRLSYHVSERDGGIYNAQNKGMRQAKGEYLLFLNSGDFLSSPDVLERVFNYRRTEDIVYGDLYLDRGVGQPVYAAQPPELTFEFMIHTTLWHPAAFIRKTLFERLGPYNEELKIVSDYEFFLRAVICESCSTAHVPVAIAVFKTDGIGSSAEYHDLHLRERALVQYKYFDKKSIQAAIRLNELQRSKAVLFARWLDAHPFLKSLVKAGFRSINGIRKLFR